MLVLLSIEGLADQHIIWQRIVLTTRRLMSPV